MITLRAARLIEKCPVILYTGSLVPKDILDTAAKDSKILDSSGMTLEDIEAIFKEAFQKGEDVARVHTGDPSIFASVAEQMRRLKHLCIEYEVIPGVSSFCAAAAVLGKELTLPELSQTIIITRAEGRTPVPSKESLTSLGEHQSTLVLFLSITLMKKVQRELIPSYGLDCPIAIVHKASLPEQKIIEGTLENIVSLWEDSGIRSQSIVIVGRVLASEDFADSRLYAADFHHKFRPPAPKN